MKKPKLRIESGYEIVPLKSGLHSLRSLDNGETFHPGIGPRAEADALHVLQQNLFQRAQSRSRFVIWDVGLGAAANALAAISALQESSAQVELHSFDHSASGLHFAIESAAQLEYVQGSEAILRELYELGSTKPAPQISWIFHRGDFCRTVSDLGVTAPDAIFYDPYSPKSNPDMWTVEHFSALYRRLVPSRPCLWTNYTRSTAVRVALLLAGFYVGVGTAIGEKSETTLATNSPELLGSKLLDRKWLERVKVSTSAAPFRIGAAQRAPISPADWEQLRQCAQFCL